MKKTFINLIAALFIVCSASAFAANPTMKGWVVQGGGTGIYEGFRYDLRNTNSWSYLRYQDRWGANLGWNGSPGFFITVKRQFPSSRPISCEEPFALFVEKSWFRYGVQDYGINLTSNSLNSTMYQWKFTNCGAPGSVVQLNTHVALANNITSDSVVGCSRLYGVNLCWGGDVIKFQGKNYRRQDVNQLIKLGLVSAAILGVPPIVVF